MTPTAMTIHAGQLPLHVSPEVPTDPIYRLSVAQYHEMINRGILTEDDQVELLEGWLVPKIGKNPPHRIATRLTREMLARKLPPGWYVDSQEPITTSDSEPEPDIAVIRGDTQDYPDRHPGPIDVALVVEVADATLRRDRTIKKRAYARAGVPVYWIVNLTDRLVEVYTEPSGPGERPDFRGQVKVRENEVLALVIEGKNVASIPVSDLLPRVVE